MSSREARSGDSTAAAVADSMSPGNGAAAEMRDAVGGALGTILLSELNGNVMLSGSLRGVPPGKHGMHIHATRRCEPPFESAGDHWNPTSSKHGLENPAGPHHGDMMALSSAPDSIATVQHSLAAGTMSELFDGDGATLIIHAMDDDQRTDPSGNSGDRIACGVIIR